MAAGEESLTGPSPARRPAPASGAVVVVVAGPITPEDVPTLCERVRSMLEGSAAEAVVCDVSALTEPDLVTVDALAWLALTARRLGRRMRLRGASDQLCALLALVGLDGVIGP